MLSSLFYTSHKKYYHEDILTPLKKVNELMSGNDKLIVDGNNKICFMYYKNLYKFDDDTIIFASDDLNEFKKELRKLKRGRYFYIFSHYRERNKWLSEIAQFVNVQQDNKIYSDAHGNALFVFTIF